MQQPQCQSLESHLLFSECHPEAALEQRNGSLAFCFFVEDIPTFRTAIIALKTTFINGNHLRVITAKSACSATYKHRHTHTRMHQVHSKNAAIDGEHLKRESMALQNLARLLDYGYSLLRITAIILVLCFTFQQHTVLLSIAWFQSLTL